MKRSSIVLWGLVGVLVAIAVAVSCADTGGNGGCTTDGCVSDCVAVGHISGHCSAGACMCTDVEAGADADTLDVRPDDTTPPPDDSGEVRPDEASPPDDARPDEATAEDRVDRRDDYVPPDRPGDETTPPPPDSGPDYKSSCDPLVCFMSCGGTCSVGGTCVCEPK